MKLRERPRNDSPGRGSLVHRGASGSTGRAGTAPLSASSAETASELFARRLRRARGVDVSFILGPGCQKCVTGVFGIPSCREGY
jgi:hypothetical protein